MQISSPHLLLSFLFDFICYQYFKNLTMNKVKRVLGKFDMFSVPVSLKANSKPKMKTQLAGAVSFLLVCVFAYFFISNCISVFKHEQIISTSKDSRVDKTIANATFHTFALSIDYLNFTEFDSMFDVYASIYVEKQLIQSIFLVPCTQLMWKGLDSQTFLDYGIDQMFCPSNNSPFKLQQTYRSRQPSFITITLTPCSTLYQECSIQTLKAYIINQTQCCRGVEVSVYIFDKIVYQTNSEAVNVFVNMDVKGIISSRFGEQVFVQFATFKINTDYSIWPIKQIRSDLGNFVQTIRQNQFPINTDNLTGSPLAIFTFTMNEKLKIYTREVGKLDKAFALSGGFITIIMSFAGFFVISYNTYKFDTKMAEQSFKKDDKTINYSDMKLTTYIKYTIYTQIKRLTGRQINWQQCKTIDRNTREASGLMEITRIFKRLQQIQSTLKRLVDPNQIVCLNLLGPPSLQQTKHQRLICSYYSVVLKGKLVLAIKDVRNKHEAQKLSLEQFYVTHRFAIKAAAQNHLAQSEKTQENQNLNDNKGTLASLQNTYFNSTQKQTNTMMVTKWIQPMNLTFTTEKQEGKNSKSIFGAESHDLFLLSKFIDLFEGLKKQADQIQLSQNYLKVQRTISKSFHNLSHEKRKQFQQQIPIIILHRLLKCLKEQQQQKQQKKQEKRTARQKKKDKLQIKSETKAKTSRVNSSQKKEHHLNKYDSNQSIIMNARSRSPINKIMGGSI